MPPETSHYSPKMRIVDATDDRTLEFGAQLISAEVVQVCTGVAQLHLKLSNQRAGGGPGASTAAGAQWRFNDLSELRFGQRIRADFGYVDPAREDNNVAWTPMILARITDLQFDFPTDGASVLGVEAEDLLSLFKVKPEQNRTWRNTHEWLIVDDIRSLARARHLGWHDDHTLYPDFGETLRRETLQSTQSYLQLMQAMAERLDFEVFVDFDNHDQPSNSVSLHFRPARSLSPPSDNEIELHWERDFERFTPRFEVWEQPTSAEVRGRHSRRRETIEGRAAADVLEADLHAQTDADITAIAARARLVEDAGDSPNPRRPSATNMDSGRAIERAKAELLSAARKFLTVEAGTIGRPDIRAGRHVIVGGFGAPFDGIYYITKATHRFDDSGYRTGISLRRPGMRAPQEAPATEPAEAPAEETEQGSEG